MSSKPTVQDDVTMPQATPQDAPAPASDEHASTAQSAEAELEDGVMPDFATGGYTDTTSSTTRVSDTPTTSTNTRTRS